MNNYFPSLALFMHQGYRMQRQQNHRLLLLLFFSKWVFESIVVLLYIVVNQFRLRKKLPVDPMLA